jgi:hypothetical protein
MSLELHDFGESTDNQLALKTFHEFNETEARSSVSDVDQAYNILRATVGDCILQS